MTPEEFAAQTKAAAAQVGRLSDEGVRNAKAILRETQKELVLQLANAPTEYGEWFYTQMQASLDNVATALATRYRHALDSDLDAVAEGVIDAIDRPIEEAGITIALPQVSRQVVEMMSGFSPGELIQGLAGDVKTTIQGQIQQAILGTITPWELQQSLAKSLDEASIFGSLHARAEAIWRTEAARVYNVLAQERYRRIELMQPGRMKKQWLHSGNTNNPRSAHQALDGETIGIHEMFDVNGHPADGPHDPNLPASETIRCGCTSILVLAQ